MADIDKLTALLKSAKLSDAQRAGLWDLYQAAKNEDDLAERLKSLQLPDKIKADLWNLKAAGSTSSPSDLRADETPKGEGFFGPLQRPDGRVSTELSIGVEFDGKETQIPLLVPSLSKQEVDTLLKLGDEEPIPDAIADKAVKYARLRMQAGKSPFAGPEEVGKFKPLPFAFDPNRQRKDVNVIGLGKGQESPEPDVAGISPDVLNIGMTQVGRAVIPAGLSVARRITAGAGAAGAVASPIIQAEAVYHGLKAVGVPDSFARIGAAVVAGRAGARGIAREGTPTIAEAEAVGAETTPLGFPKPAQPVVTGPAFTKQLAAEHRTLRGIPAEGYPSTRPSAPPVNPLKTSPEAVKEEFKAFFKPALEQAAKVPKLTAEEMSAGAKMLKAGMSAPEVLQAILKQRELLESSSFSKLPRR